MREFLLRRSRQVLAIALTILILLFLLLLYRRHDFFGEVPKNTIVGAEIVVIIAFIGFSAFNWRCPSCKGYIGADQQTHVQKVRNQIEIMGSRSGSNSVRLELVTYKFVAHPIEKACLLPRGFGHVQSSLNVIQ
jgi:hypothetical protein